MTANAPQSGEAQRRRPGGSGGDPSARDDSGSADESVTWRQRLRYRFDNLLARGTWATLVWLGVVTLVAVLISSLLLAVFGVGLSGSNEGGWLEDFWQSLLRVIDAGTMAGDVGWGRRILALLVTVFGLLVAGTLIGIIAAAVEDRIDGMRRGRSAVIESGHLVVLGASDQLPGLLEQVAIGSAPGQRTTVVVLADGDPAEIDRRLQGAITNRGALRLVLRSGDPSNVTDLGLVRLRRSRGVVVLHDGRADDVGVVRVVLATQDVLAGDAAIPVVVEVVDEATAGRLVDACGPTVHPLHTAVALSRTAAFALLGPVMADVLGDLLVLGGADVRVRTLADVGATTFGEVVRNITSDRPIGLLGPSGHVVLRPDDDHAVHDGDRLIVIGRPVATTASGGSAGTAVGVGSAVVRGARTPRSGAAPTTALPASDLTAPAAGSAAAAPPGGPAGPAADVPTHASAVGLVKVLVVGWSQFGARVLEGWLTMSDRSVEIEVVITDPDVPTALELPPGTSATVIRTTSLVGHLDARGGLGDLDAIIVLPDGDRRTPEEADIRSLLDLGVIRRYRGAEASPRLIVQLLDVDDVPLARLDRRDDWLIDPGVTAQLLAQLVDLPVRRDVLLTLYADQGPSLDVVAADALGLAGTVDVATVVDAAHRAGLLAIGWSRGVGDRRETVLAPPPDVGVTFGPDDAIVVIR